MRATVRRGAVADQGCDRVVRGPARGAVALLRAINVYRKGLGLAELVASPTLTAAGRGYAKVMADSGHWRHVGADGSTFDQRICDAGYAAACSRSAFLGENLARGTLGGKATFDAWKASPGHDIGASVDVCGE